MKDCFLNQSFPDLKLTEVLRNRAVEICHKENISLYCGTVFSTDSIVAQFSHIDFLMRNHNCIGIDMEASAVFKAAKTVNIKAAALLQTSDVIPANKSIFCGRTEEEMKRRKFIKMEVLPKIILDSLILEK